MLPLAFSFFSIFAFPKYTEFIPSNSFLKTLVSTVRIFLLAVISLNIKFPGGLFDLSLKSSIRLYLGSITEKIDFLLVTSGIQKLIFT